MKKKICSAGLFCMLFVLIGSVYFFSYGALHFNQKLLFMGFFVPFIVLFLEVKLINILSKNIISTDESADMKKETMTQN